MNNLVKQQQQQNLIRQPFETRYGLISGECLHYYLVYTDQNGKAASTNCIRLNARWMQQQFNLIANRTLEQIMIPGTHDASSFEHYKQSDYETNGKVNRIELTRLT